MPHVRVNGIDFHYDLAGPEGAPTVAFSHSVGSAINMWEPMMQALTARYRCLRYDTRGHGGSGASPAAITIDDLADDLVGILDALGIDRAHIAGLSLGGMTGQSVAARYPGRVASLTLIATAAYLPPLDFWEKRAATVRAEGPAAIVDTVMGRWFTEPFRNSRPEIVSEIRKLIVATPVAGYAGCCNAIPKINATARLKEITCPILVIVGADDPATPVAMAREIQDNAPGSQLVVLPQAAHLANLEQPAGFTRALQDFLSSN